MDFTTNYFCLMACAVNWYHPDVETWRGGRKKFRTPNSEPKTHVPEEPQPSTTNQMSPAEPTQDVEQEAKVPTVRVNLVQSVHLLPHQSLVVEVRFAGDKEVDGSEAYLLEPAELKSGLQVEPSRLSLSVEDGVLAVLNNPTGCSMSLEATTRYPNQADPDEELLESIQTFENLSSAQQRAPHSLRTGGERARSGDAEPRRCPPRRMPFAVREEVAKQLEVSAIDQSLVHPGSDGP